MTRNTPSFLSDSSTSGIPSRTTAASAIGNNSKSQPTPVASEEIRQLIQDVTADIKDLEQFYNLSISRQRIQRLGEYNISRQNEAIVRFSETFNSELDQQGKVDFTLLLNLLKGQASILRDEWARLDKLEPLLGSWTEGLIGLVERRQKVDPLEPKDAAQTLTDAGKKVDALRMKVEQGELYGKVVKPIAFKAVEVIEELKKRLTEWFAFYNEYDPLFTWWVSAPWKDLPDKMTALASIISEKLVGVKLEDGDAIIGLPSGRESILADLQVECIAYSPEEIIEIGESEYKWCEKEMIKASKDLGYGEDWREALEHVKRMYAEPGDQIYLVHALAKEAVEYVTKHDMVTIPQVANETWRTFMMTPARQKVNPFFLGGDSIIVSYPTSTMSHEDKLMSMRGNNGPFSRSTVLHELLPGHHLQFYYMGRSRPYRKAFETPFWIEGWAFYWEMILWDRGFPDTPENKIGMLFWRMHRCARIVFSLKFHLGKMSPQECVDYLVEKVGHERATAEGEVRRSFNGEYSPLYQAGYMLGALQIYSLRKEVVDGRKMSEKSFHDRFLKENNMPIELFRALLTNEKLEPRHKPSWRFYDSIKH